MAGILQHYWNDIKKEVKQSQEIKDEISQVELVMEDGSSAQLSDFYLPLLELKARALEYLDEEGMEGFPLLDLSDTLEPDDLSKWSFLNDTFGVRKRDDIEFYLKILSVLANQDAEPDSELSKKLYMLYEAIYRKSRESADPRLKQAQQKVIQAYFQDDYAVLVPDRDFRTWMWTQPTHARTVASLEKSEKQELVSVFKDTALIFAADSWHRIEDCLWSSATEIEGKVILNGLYPDLESLFVNVLGVRTLTLQMAFDKLERLGKSNVSLISEVKSTWIAFHSLLSQADIKPDSAPLLRGRLFPVKYPDGHANLCSATSPFAIIDRKQHGILFSGKVMTLDYSFEEVYQIQATIKWAGLDTRYTSVTVKDVSAIVGGNKTSVSNPERDLKPKTHGLCRIAAHFKSPKALTRLDSLYRVLKNAETFETDGITTELQLQQGNSTVSDGPGVPTTESATCLGIIMQTLTVCYDNIEAILDGSGITGVSISDEYEVRPGAAAQPNEPSSQAPRSPRVLTVAIQAPLTSNDDEEPNSDSETLKARESHHVKDAPMLKSPNSPNHHPLFSQAPRSQHSSGLSAALPAERRPQSPAHTGKPARVPERSANEEDSTGDYTALLSRVVESILRMARLGRAVNGVNARQDADEIIRFYSSNKPERDRMIGAAGELYVFDPLSKMKSVLPGFGRMKWTSTIRKHVRKHPDYSDMIPWNGRETADIVYHDTTGALTGELEELAYLDEGFWVGARPRYYIEVKTTTGSCETPFYMSKDQFKRIQSKSNAGPNGSADIYVIFRVSNLGSDSIDLAIYADPECIRKSRELEFTTETYSVTPGLGRDSDAPKDSEEAPNGPTGLSWNFRSASGTANTPFSPTNQEEPGSSGASSIWAIRVDTDDWALQQLEHISCSDTFKHEHEQFFGSKASGSSLFGGASTQPTRQGLFGTTPLFGSSISTDAAGLSNTQPSQASSGSGGTGIFGSQPYNGPSGSRSTGGLFSSGVPADTSGPKTPTGFSFGFPGLGSPLGNKNSPPAAGARDNRNGKARRDQWIDAT
ncbi:hypothetical protein BJ170DRAFT_593357 [Xylariales sp. AK1849]|nr:hypothetical protein BJ170DRAFT_593357 [Xylariales sp. AK1849]